VWTLGYVLALLFEALPYNPQGHGFDSLYGQWEFRQLNPSGSTMALGPTQPLMGGKGSECRGLTTLQPSSAHCLELLGASTS